MKRYRQSVEEILTQLTTLETSWRDNMADAVLEKLARIEPKGDFSKKDIEEILDVNDGVYKDSSPRARFDAGLTAIRLFLDLYKINDKRFSSRSITA